MIMSMKQKQLSVIILTLNEEVNLPHCLESLSDLSVDIFIVDAGSTDKTLEIARQYGCNICTHPFDNHAAQLNRALEALPINTPWIMRLDADERLTPELVKELQHILSKRDTPYSGFQVRRRVYFWGKWIRYGGYYPTWLLRVWRSGSAYCEHTLMDEHMVLIQGRSGKLKNDIIDENRKGLGFWTNKHNHYADNEVHKIINQTSEQAVPQGQAGAKRWAKKHLYGRSPLFVRAFIYWFLRYILLLGFLDGRAGMVFHFLQAFWYRFLIDAKYYEHRTRVREK